MKNDKLPCDHKNWAVLDSCTIGSGKCLDCDREIPLSVLFDSLRQKMEAALELVKVSSLDVPSTATLVIEAEIGTLVPEDKQKLRDYLLKDGFKRLIFINTMPGRRGLKFTALKNIESGELIGTRHEE